MGLVNAAKPNKTAQTSVPTIVKETIKKENLEESENGTETSTEPVEYEIVEKEILPEKMICPDCGGITLVGLDFCDKCGGELANYENF
ncbi:hypothetical protein R2R35_08600 [Anaerocolumna sp. AGMB13020]|uniref:hypothetical protein n=1 Tax=Anaerocolumna sp. AGMB13020 TaxID=3081750 RepID=UPI002953E16F|nr:hypothetical protein [Anaerocolumna sp. AGMB13020]WOO38548.1 hypothetical protein R2R35_08600 [Anaerocolumna sp. AGMB13020]